ncbi:MAG: ATP-binding cassette domain-containing protein, partial [Bilophila wadsworthia]
MALLSLQGVTLNLGGKTLLDTADLHVEQGERVCLVGRNGVGKSSLMALLSGDLTPDGGTIVRTPGVTFGHMPQAVPDHWSGPVFGVVASGLGKEGEALAAAHLIATGREDQLSAAKLALARDLLQSGEGWERHGDILEAINQLGLDPEADFATLSGGNKRRVALARALVASENLLLDEPTNHLDIKTIAWLEDFLVRRVKTFVFISHDRAFVRRLATRIVEVDRSQLYSYACTFDQFLERREERLDAEEKQAAAFD